MGFWFCGFDAVLGVLSTVPKSLFTMSDRSSIGLSLLATKTAIDGDVMDFNRHLFAGIIFCLSSSIDFFLS